MDTKYLFEAFDFGKYDEQSEEDEIIQEIKDSVLTKIVPDAFIQYGVKPEECMAAEALQLWKEYVGDEKPAYVLSDGDLREKYDWGNNTLTLYHCGLDHMMDDAQMPFMGWKDGVQAYVFVNNDTKQAFMAFGHLGYKKIILPSNKIYKGAEYFKSLIEQDARMFQNI